MENLRFTSAVKSAILNSDLEFMESGQYQSCSALRLLAFPLCARRCSRLGVVETRSLLPWGFTCKQGVRQ